jgi:thiol-disulfide isomerase/thioredoxin
MSYLVTTLMQFSLLATGADDYGQAYKVTRETGRPLVVFVGADWCSHCRAMKQNVIPQLSRRGSLSSVAFVAVDADAEHVLAERLTKRGHGFPQWIMFTKTDGTWTRTEMTGAKSVEEVEAFLAAGGATQPLVTLGSR